MPAIFATHERRIMVGRHVCLFLAQYQRTEALIEIQVGPDEPASARVDLRSAAGWADVLDRLGHKDVALALRGLLVDAACGNGH